MLPSRQAQVSAFWGLPSPRPLLYPLSSLQRIDSCLGPALPLSLSSSWQIYAFPVFIVTAVLLPKEADIDRCVYVIDLLLLRI